VETTKRGKKRLTPKVREQIIQENPTKGGNGPSIGGVKKKSGQRAVHGRADEHLKEYGGRAGGIQMERIIYSKKTECVKAWWVGPVWINGKCTGDYSL